MKTDIRIRYTKEKIRKTFFQLLNKKNFSDITVTEICQIAEINRTTFYKHYLDINDLLEKIEHNILVHTKDQCKYLCPQNTITGLETILSGLEQDQYQDISSIFKADPLFSFKISEFICQYTVPNYTNTSYTAEEQSLIQRIMIYGYGSVTRNWLLSPKNNKMTAHELATFLFQLTEIITSSPN